MVKMSESKKENAINLQNLRPEDSFSIQKDDKKERVRFKRAKTISPRTIAEEKRDKELIERAKGKYFFKK